MHGIQRIGFDSTSQQYISRWSIRFPQRLSSVSVMQWSHSVTLDLYDASWSIFAHCCCCHEGIVYTSLEGRHNYILQDCCWWIYLHKWSGWAQFKHCADITHNILHHALQYLWCYYPPLHFHGIDGVCAPGIRTSLWMIHGCILDHCIVLSFLLPSGINNAQRKIRQSLDESFSARLSQKHVL